MEKSKIGFIGCLEMGIPILKSLVEGGIAIDSIITISPEKAEKSNVSGYYDYASFAIEHGIELYVCSKYSLKSSVDEEFFRTKNFDLLIQGGWQRLFPETVLSSLTVGAIGIHGSSDFLPKGRGRSPINWSLIQGKSRFIFHYFIMKPGADDGDIFHYEIVDINPWDNCRTMYYKNSMLSTQVYVNWIPRLLRGDFEVIPQKGEPTYFAKRIAEDGLINWEWNIFDIHNFIRALTHPYPGAFTYIEQEKVLVWSAQPLDTKMGYPNAAFGEIIQVFENDDLVVNCSGGLLLITDYSSSKKIKTGDKFLVNGRK